MATTTERSTAVETNDDLMLLRRVYLPLSLSTASRVIVKHSGGCGQQRRQRQTSGGGAFRCKTCGRAFPTFQALGGHRTSHKRSLVRAHGLDLLLGARPGKSAATAGVASDVHRCTTCGAVFPTGQALGGHMRRHKGAVNDEGETAKMRVVVNALSSGVLQGEDEGDAGAIRLFKFI